MNGKFRILSLDGGGTWALIQVRALQDLYGDIYGHEVLKKFDLVAANSGGSIVAACLALNMQLSRIYGFFTNEEERRTVFVELPEWEKLEPNRWFGIGPRYSGAKKLVGLRHLLGAGGDTPLSKIPGQMGDGAPDFLITSFDFDRARAVYFRSNQESLAAGPGAHADPSLAQVVHASTNAPVNYFDAPAQFGDRSYWDGGVAGNNNPVFAAVVEALANGRPAGEIKALSIGTGSVSIPADGPSSFPQDLIQPPQKSSLVHDLRELATSILDDPPDSASFHAHVALGQPLPKPGEVVGNGSVVRMNPLVRPVIDPQGRWTVPGGLNIDQFRALKVLDMDAVANDDVKLIVALADAWLACYVPNQPIRESRDLRAFDIGQERFKDAKAAWFAL